MIYPEVLDHILITIPTILTKQHEFMITVITRSTSLPNEAPVTILSSEVKTDTSKDRKHGKDGVVQNS